jgi:hypothetical protein
VPAPCEITTRVETICRKLGAVSHVRCQGAPTGPIAACVAVALRGPKAGFRRPDIRPVATIRHT